MFVGIQNGIPDFIQVGPFHQGSGGTTVNALSAVGTDYLGHGEVLEGADFLMLSLMGHCKGIDTLQLFTGSHTPLATNAFAVVFLYGR